MENQPSPEQSSRLFIEQFWQQQKIHAQKVAEEAKQIGLIPLRRHQGLWIKDDPNINKEALDLLTIPSSFYTATIDSDTNQINFYKHQLEFPIATPEQLVETLKSLNILYESHVGILSSFRHGPEGLIEYIEENIPKNP